MAMGENAEKYGRCGREYWSRRLGGPMPWGSVAKGITHGKERALCRRIEHMAIRQMADE